MKFRIASIVFSVWACAAACVAAPMYTVQDLGTLGGTTSSALDVNSSREATGNSSVLSDPGSTGSLLRAYRWSGGVMTNLGSMAPIPPSTSTNRFARGYAINDSGVVVGEFNNDSSRAFVYSGGVMSGLTRLAGDNDNGVAHDINNAGVIVGVSSNGSASRPTKWTNSGSGYAPADLGTLAGTSNSTGRAWSINQNGVAVGLSSNGTTSQATMWDGGSIINLGSLGDGNRFGQAYSVNDSKMAVGASTTGQTVGQLIGTSSTTDITRAFVWNSGTITELTPFNLYGPGNTGPTTNYHSEAKDINNAGLVVGNSQRISGSAAVATLWEGGVPIDLNSLIPGGSGWNLLSAEGINANGDIVGFGTIGGVQHAFLLTAVPEPSTMALLVAALLGAMQLHRYRS
ncbi:MAG: PEP-CTERM sorting domain-containing protein [Pirellulales bacterium]